MAVVVVDLKLVVVLVVVAIQLGEDEEIGEPVDDAVTVQVVVEDPVVVMAILKDSLRELTKDQEVVEETAVELLGLVEPRAGISFNLIIYIS